MTKHHISHSDELYSGDAYLAGAHSLYGRRGLPIALPVFVNFGAVVTADADGVCASQSVTAGAESLINGALAVGGVGVFDVPRNVVAAWTTSAVITVTGFDEYGEPMVESATAGTTFTGLKAFKRVTSVTFSANVTGATVGSGVRLGLPARVDAGGLMGSSDAVGTFTAAATATPTATTGDVRGTVQYTAAPNGSAIKTAMIIPAGRGSAELAFGRTQFAG